MKRIVVFLAVIVCVAVVTGRNLNDLKSEDEDSDIQLEKHVRDPTNSQMRHRRRSRQSYNNRYPYDYDNYNNNYFDSYDRRYDHRRDYNINYNRREEELLSRILKQIEEISLYIKLNRSPPPPPPQIIYIPYPYPVPQCQNQSNAVPNLPPRIDLSDKNQNWGLVPGVTAWDDDESDGSRPINLDPIVSNEPTAKTPPVDHGTSQAGMTTARPTILEPGRCKAAILVCCQDTTPQEKQRCFAQYGCNKTYSIATACDPIIVKRVIAEFAEAYAPINRT